MRNRFVIMILVAAGFLSGSVMGVNAQKVREHYTDAVRDADGRAIHLGDIIQGTAPGAVPIKVNGWTVTTKPGTFVAFGYQVRLCPSCKWVETATGAALRAPKAWFANLSLSILNTLDPPAHAAADGDSIIWGS